MIRWNSMFNIVTSFFLLAVMCSPHAHGQSKPSAPGANAVYFEETFFPVFVSKNDAAGAGGGSKTKSVPHESGFGYDARTTIGYVMSNILLGLTLNKYQFSSHRNTTPDYEGNHLKDSKTEYGLTLGSFLGSWRLAYTHFLSSKREVSSKYTDPANSSISTSEVWMNSNGKGFQVALGYDFSPGSTFSISPTLVYRWVKYVKQEYRVDAGAGTSYGQSRLTTDALDEELKPMITMIVRF